MTTRNQANGIVRLGAMLLFALASSTAFALGGGGGTIASVSGFSNPGNLNMYKYVPDGLPSGAPLVIALHGCSQNANDYFDDPGWDKMADTYGFALLVPEQKTGNNYGRCFNWFEPGDYQRGSGESASIMNAADKVISDHNLNSGQLYITGLSGGGAMTAQMLAHYPDRFKGGAIMAGVVAGCATSSWQGFSCMSSPSGTPSGWGNYVRGRNPGYSGPWPRVAVWHGTADGAVSHQNLTELMEQWTNVHGTDQVSDATSSVQTATRRQYRKNGVTVVETWSISGMEHGTAVDPGNGSTQCGIASKYFPDVNICSSYHVVKFWGLD